MDEILTYISENKNWIFSGIGIFIIGTIYKVFSHKDNSPILNNNITIDNSTTNTPENKIADSTNLEELKRKIRILFIDDDTKFKTVKILKNAGWINTKTIKDVKSYDDQVVLESNIIFVDIQGVGKVLNCKDEGLGLSKNLKRKYPDKKIIIYSAEAKGNRFHEALREADYFLSKNADAFEFQNIVEKFSKEIYGS